MKTIFNLIALLCLSVAGLSQTVQTFNVNQIRPSTINTYVLTTVNGQTVWAPQQGRCGHDFIPCLNTPNTWLTGEQVFQAGNPNTIPIVFQGAPGGFSTPTFIQAVASGGGGGFGECVATLPSPVTPGNLIIALSVTGSAATVTDTQGDTYTTIASTGLGTGQTVLISNNSVGGTTTAHFSNVAEVNGCILIEYAGVAAANPIDAILLNGGGTWSGSASTGPITTTNANDLVVTWLDGSTLAPTVSPNTFTLNYTDPTNGIAGQATNAVGTFSATWSAAGGSVFNTGIMALKAASPLYQTAPLAVCRDWTGAQHCEINSLGQYVPPSYPTGATNVPDGPALAYDTSKNCPEYYNVGLSAWNPLCNHTAPIAINCSGSGSINVSLVDQSINYKKLIIYANACTGTASYSYPVAFTHTPQIISQSLTAAITSLSVTSVTFTGSASTGFVELDGY